MRQTHAAGIAGTLALLLLAGACTTDGERISRHASSRTLRASAYVLQLPLWTNPYAAEPGNPIYLDIDRVMKDAHLSRLQAVEVQNQMKDAFLDLYEQRDCAPTRSANPNTLQGRRACFAPADVQRVFEASLQSVRSGHVECGWSEAKRHGARFILALDMDATALDEDRRTHVIRNAPGLGPFLVGVQDAGGVIVLFSARPDRQVRRILAHWQVETAHGPQPTRSFFAAVLTNHHLTVGTHLSGAHTWSTPSKDLRILDEDLGKIVLLDDNPRRVVQSNRLRMIRKWRPRPGDDSLEPTGKPHAAFYEQRFEVVLHDLVDAADYAKAYDVPFAQAFLPFTQSGETVWRDLAENAFHGDRDRARRYLQAHPGILGRGE